MEKKIDQYLPLYLGQKFVLKITNPLSQHKYTAQMYFGVDALRAALATNSDHIDPLLILRPLSSMTEEENKVSRKIFDDGYAAEKCQGEIEAERTLYLLKLGIDVFNLKEKGLCLYPEEYQDFKEFMSYKLNMDSDEFNELYEEFEKWHNGEIKTEDIKPI